MSLKIKEIILVIFPTVTCLPIGYSTTLVTNNNLNLKLIILFFRLQDNYKFLIQRLKQ